ncbi:DNA translocase FtsK [Legionella sp. CNM-4043-24]|uniref:DNA translocase FtsK n=1 Tax=Legionella sp. CNM-4043-24 TaxID=3421646 RepID=UPI00403B1D43
MAKQDMTSKNKKALPLFIMRRVSEGSFIFILSCALFVLLSLASYHPDDPAWFNHGKVSNACGQIGASIAFGLYFVFGYFAYVLPLCGTYVAWIVLQDHRALRTVDKPALLLRSSGLLFFMIGSCSLLSLNSHSTRFSAGGWLGDFIGGGFDYALSVQGASLLLMAITLAGITWLTGLSWVKAIESVGCYTLTAGSWLLQRLKSGLSLAVRLSRWFKERAHVRASVKTMPRLAAPERVRKEKSAPVLSAAPILTPDAAAKPVVVVPSYTDIAPASPIPPAAVKAPAPAKEPRPKPLVSGDLPGLELLDKGLPGKPMGGYTHQELEAVSRNVEQHLLDFGIHADVVAVHPGPVITRFELQLAPGIKVSKLSALSRDLARSLSVISVRVVEVIPGKTVVGLELPNQHREMVRLSEVLSADVYQQAHSPLTLALGVDIAGHPMVVDLAKMPHLLVAGTTGSGKSVGINAMILSLLFKATPEQVRLIMIDPKMLELSVYDGIPHLLTPVVTDMKEAASALRWCVAEMERRYRLMSALGVRNLAGYNTKVAEYAAKGEPLKDPIWKPTDSVDAEAPLLETLPFVVVFIDELADMMMVVGKKVEQLIARIAQKARAAGIHLILATQRPSVDVLTGLIKSNIPTRISFQVSSKIDSRTILDQQGAEQLLGHGDMLYQAPGTGTPLRVHGAFVDDKEVHRIADDWRARGEPDYIDEITQIMDPSEMSTSEDAQDTEEADPLFDQAVEFVLQTRKASISSVQRRLKIGYNRAARLVEEMERIGIVGPLDGGYRDVLVTSVTED